MLLKHLFSVQNQLAFSLRKRHGFHANRNISFQELAEDKSNLWADRKNATALSQLEESLLSKYRLWEFQKSASCLHYLEAMTILHFLDFLLENETRTFKQTLSMQTMSPLKWLDAGSKNFSYAQAIHAILRFAGEFKEDPAFEVTGVELDAYRRYADGYTRAAYAQAFCQPLSDVHYQIGDIFTQTDSYTIISHFLPFLSPDPLLKWGLPLRYFQPARLLIHLCSLLQPGGLLIIINQGEWEAQAQRELIETAGPPGLAIDFIGQLPDSFIDYRYPRFAWMLRKK